MIGELVRNLKLCTAIKASWPNHNRVAIIQLLLQHGADADAANKNGLTPLFLAIRMEASHIVQALLAHGAKLTFAASGMPMALGFMSMVGLINVVQHLLALGASVNATTRSGEIALSLASKEGQIEIIYLLLAAGADVTLLHKVDQWRNNGIIALLSGSFPHAIACFSRVAAWTRTSVDFVLRGAGYFCMGYLELALADAAKCAKVDELVDDYALLGLTLRRLGREDNAVAAFEEGKRVGHQMQP
ncbi:Aste57867_10825 [Aphanomyces stellatus]|uniref:Aste57867_10825 protein n=1 Tax=Aphanomyces stellatus TaxID=120398 RepID=A0A485KRW9_9STRA|nr:hypothetical protein As57867_010785 [Aphanomyces stellatus]VFT87693.1 Aste57867_10825 [Aphanomyces stellatus]